MAQLASVPDDRSRSLADADPDPDGEYTTTSRSLRTKQTITYHTNVHDQNVGEMLLVKH